MTLEAASRPEWVDFHCHLDLFPDHVSLLGECDRARVATLTVTNTPKAWARNQELARTLRFVRVALGLHPQLVGERAHELALWERLLSEARYVGEVGLDASPRFYATFGEQERVFARILRACSEHGGKVLTVHSVRAVRRVLDAIEQHLPPERGKVVLHWFTGTAAEARRAAELGCFFSVNMAMLRSPKHRGLVAQLPADRLLTETDGPFVEHEGRPVRPVDVHATVAELARVREVGEAEVTRSILANLGTLVRDS